MTFQSLYKCIHYTKNENMNKTCQNEHMCRIYYGEICKEYKEKENDECRMDIKND